MAIDFQPDGIYTAHIERPPAAKPVVETIAFYAGDKASAETTLEKSVRELHAERYDWTTLLASGEYHLLSVEAPNVPPDELKTAIRWRLKDLLDFHIDDATIDVLDVPADKNAAVRSHAIFAVAARNRIVEQRQALFSENKIPLKVIDIPEMAQRNFSALLEPEGRGVAMLSFNTDGGLLTISFAGELYLSRRIDVTLAQLSQADSEQKNGCHERITLELQRSLDHFDRQYHFITLSKLVLAPLGDAGPDLKEYLAANLYLSVEAIDLEAVLDLSRVPNLLTSKSQQRYFMALGAALRHEETVL